MEDDEDDENEEDEDEQALVGRPTSAATAALAAASLSPAADMEDNVPAAENTRIQQRGEKPHKKSKS